jgi:hypothetical protein
LVIPVDLNLILNIEVLVITLNLFRFLFSHNCILDLIYSDHIISNKQSCNYLCLVGLLVISISISFKFNEIFN